MSQNEVYAQIKILCLFVEILTCLLSGATTLNRHIFRGGGGLYFKNSKTFLIWMINGFFPLSDI